jgi:ribonuclease R
MLPEVLSNFACSSDQMKKNILFSYFEITDKCEVVDQWFGRTVIYSDQRFAYEEAQYIIETKDNTMPEKFL